MIRLLTILILLTAVPAKAEEYEYSPEGCAFTVTFPEEPYTSRRCENSDQNKCYDLVSFTQVIDMTATVNFRVICNAVSESIYEQYTQDVMKVTLKAMAKRASLDTFDASYRETPNYKQAAIVGEGLAGQNSSIYIGQLWMGKNSALSVEAEMIGDQSTEADELYSTILRSIGYKQKTENNIEAQEEKEVKPDQDDE